MIPAEALLTSTLRTLPDGPAVSRILAAALLSVEPGEAVRRSLQLEGANLAVAGQSYDLTAYRRQYLRFRGITPSAPSGSPGYGTCHKQQGNEQK